MKQSQRFKLGGQVVFSLLLILYGTILLLHNFDVLEIQSIWRSWPLIIVAIGIYKLVQAESILNIGSGVWWIFLGCWLHVSFNHVWGLSFRETWPMIIVAWGIGILWEGYIKQSRGKPSHKQLAQENGYGE
jgi:hypothetical protein